VSATLSFRSPAYWELILGLIGRDVKTRYKQSVLGYAWAVLYPLATALIFSIVGQIILRQQTGGLPYPVYAYFGLLYWNLFSSGLTAATESLVSHLNLITKVYFPREVFPVAAVLSKLVDFGFGLVGLVPLLIVYRVKPGPLFLMSLAMAGIVVLLTLGWGMLLACANLYFRDVRHTEDLAGALLAQPYRRAAGGRETSGVSTDRLDAVYRPCARESRITMALCGQCIDHGATFSGGGLCCLQAQRASLC
jgi:ABC-type polysaccharide/polyol phosphate export permease